jgi:hypothetical protein
VDGGMTQFTTIAKSIDNYYFYFTQLNSIYMKKIFFSIPFLALFAFSTPDPVLDSTAPDIQRVRGTITQGVECPYVLHRCDNNGSYVLNNLPAGFNVGDEVFVVGGVANLIDICQQGPHLGILHIHLSECR